MYFFERLTYEQFLDAVLASTEKKLGESYFVESKQIRKNNGTVYDGIVISQKDEEIMPNIYLSEYYDQYLAGKKMEQITDEIIAAYEDTYEERKELGEAFEFKYPQIKKQLVFRVISCMRNVELLKEMPYIPFLDCAITFQCIAKIDDKGLGTVRITNEHLKDWNITVSELFQAAYENTKRIMPATIRTMEEILADLLGQEIAASDEADKDDILQLILANPKENKASMYVMTNELGINGAGCLLYQEELDAFEKWAGGDFYILPSSIHELILVPNADDFSISSLEEMVKDINDTKVPVEEVLSDQVYLYSQVKKERNQLMQEYCLT
ncbi:MAG: hypothetical protein E7256_17955 [Lachnospiraceae bacterium]|nr:hypothetical protein [Lachnospiraceae bacterium]